MTECQEWSFEVRMPFGVWGGVSEDERLGEIRRRTRLASLERARVRADELPAALSA
jgi:hypothetical protein